MEEGGKGEMMNSEIGRRTPWHLIRTVRTSGARQTEASKESMTELCPVYNHCSRASFTHTVASNPMKASQTKQTRRYAERKPGLGARGRMAT